MSTKKIIEKCGGPARVAADLGVHQHTVERWMYKSGIPLRYWWYFIEQGVTERIMYRAWREL